MKRGLERIYPKRTEPPGEGWYKLQAMGETIPLALLQFWPLRLFARPTNKRDGKNSLSKNQFYDFWMLYRLYEKWLERSVSSALVPQCVAMVIPYGLGGEWQKIRQLIDWCTSVGVKNVLISAIDDDPKSQVHLVAELKDAPVKATLHVDQKETVMGRGGPLELSISLNYSGKREVTTAIRELLKDVESGRLDPKNIDEKKIESKLQFKEHPDLMIRLGGRQLSDFMIWQSSYSELYFAKTNWDDLRKIDFLHAIKSYQQRERRFGK